MLQVEDVGAVKGKEECSDIGVGQDCEGHCGLRTGVLSRRSIDAHQVSESARYCVSVLLGLDLVSERI